MGIQILKEKKVKDLKGIHLFDLGASNNAMRVRLLLEEKKLSWESHTVNLASFEQFEKEYLEINPQGSVPTLIHDGVSVYGSENILKYIEKVFPSPNLTSSNEAEMWEWVESATRTHIETGIGYLYSKRSGRPARLDMLPVYKDHNHEKYKFFLVERGHHMTETQKQETLNIINAKLQMLEDQLKAQSYIMGNIISVADIAWFPDLMFLSHLGYDFSSYSNVISWIKRMQGRPSYSKKTKMPKYIFKMILPLMRLLANNKKNTYVKEKKVK